MGGALISVQPEVSVAIHIIIFGETEATSGCSRVSSERVRIFKGGHVVGEHGSHSPVEYAAAECGGGRVALFGER